MRIHGAYSILEGRTVHVPCSENDPLDFSENISPLGMSASVCNAAREAVSEAHCYPDPKSAALCSSIAAHYGIEPVSIICGAGASDLIWRLSAALSPEHVCIFEPTFSEYGFSAQAFGAHIHRILLDAGNGFTVTKQHVDAIPSCCDLVFLCNPNNPTGRLVAPDVMEHLITRCLAIGSFLAVDECFLDFCESESAQSLVHRAAQTDSHIAVFSAFTKFYAMPGLRVGYMLSGDASVLAHMSSIGSPWPISNVAAAAAQVALEDEAYASELRTLVKRERNFMMEGFHKLGLRVIPSDANFVLFYTDVSSMGTLLAKKNILARSCADFVGLGEGWYRVAVRTHAENEALMSALSAVVSSAVREGGAAREGDAARKGSISRKGSARQQSSEVLQS